MNRYTITQDNHTYHLYYPTLEAAKQTYPNAIIELYTDTTFIEYVEKIKSMSHITPMGWWKIPYGLGYIAYYQYKDEDGYLDGCEYVRYDHHSYTLPFMKTITDPKSFYERFFDDDMVKGEHGFNRLSKRQFDKLKGKAKPVRFCTIDGTVWYVDGYGNFFEHIASDTGKKSIEEWNKFHDNPDAVWAQIWHGVYGKCSLQWYSSMDEFMADFKAKAKATPTWASTPRYKIKKIGYRKKHPYDRENYIRLPFYPVAKVPKNERNVVEIVDSWKELAKNIGYYSKGFYGDIYFENVIKKYWEWVDKNEL